MQRRMQQQRCRFIPPFLLLTLLVHLLQLSVDGAASTTTISPSRTPTTLTGCVSVTTAIFLSRCADLYNILRPEITIASTIARNAIGEICTDVISQDRADFALPSLVPSIAQRSLTPDLVYVPFFATPFSAIYNLPGSPAITLNRSVLARIFSGNITFWNDPSIVALNPALTLPHHGIELVLQSDPFPYVQDFAQTSSEVDAEFASLINVALVPNWPVSRYSKVTWVTETIGAASYIVSAPYSLGLSLTSFANKLNAFSASMVNTAGYVVQPTYDATLHAFIELSVLSSRSVVDDGDVTDLDYGWVETLTNAPGDEAWPYVAWNGLLLPRHYSHQSCHARSELVKFLSWILEADAPRNAIGREELAVLVTGEMDEALGVGELFDDLICEDHGINTGNAPPLKIVGPELPIPTSVRDIITNYYTATVSATNGLVLKNVEGDELEAMISSVNPDRLGTEADMSWFFPATLPYEDFESEAARELAYRVYDALVMLPVGLHGIGIKYALPAGLTIASTALPLVLDMEALGGIFSGAITSWADPALTKLNPALGVALATAPATVTTITIVVRGDGTQDHSDSMLSNHFVHFLNLSTQAFRTYATSPGGKDWTIPADWTGVQARPGVNMVLVDTEKQLEMAIQRIPGAIGYILISKHALDANLFDLLRTVTSSTGVKTTSQVSSTVESFRACGNALTTTGTSASLSSLVDELTSTLSSTSSSAQTCWPLTILLGLALPMEASNYVEGIARNGAGKIDPASVCQRALKCASIAQWLLSTDHGAFTRSGLASAASIPLLASEIDTRLNLLTCQNAPLLWSPDVVWVFPSALQMIGRALAGVGWAIILLVCIGLFFYRRRSIIRAVPWPHQYGMLTGLALLLVTLIVFVEPASPAICTTLVWTLSIGSTLGLGIPCIKIIATWRHMQLQAERRRALKREKVLLTTQRFIYVVLALMLTADIILLSTAQANGGLLQPITSSVTQNGFLHVYEICSFPNAVLPHAIISICIKLLLLFASSLLSFVARRGVSAFNETEHLTWVSWNTTISVILMTPIIVFSGGSLGDTASALELALLIWLIYLTLIFIYGPTFFTLVRDELAERKIQQGLSSHATTSGRSSGTSGTMTVSELSTYFDQPSLDEVSLTTLEKYISALELQLESAKLRRLKEFGSPYDARKLNDRAYDTKVTASVGGGGDKSRRAATGLGAVNRKESTKPNGGGARGSTTTPAAPPPAAAMKYQPPSPSQDEQPEVRSTTLNPSTVISPPSAILITDSPTTPPPPSISSAVSSSPISPPPVLSPLRPSNRMKARTSAEYVDANTAANTTGRQPLRIGNNKNGIVTIHSPTPAALALLANSNGATNGAK